MSLQFSQARQKLHQLARSATPRLAEAALWIAKEEYPDLNLQLSLGELNQIAQRIKAQIPDPPYPLKVIQSLNQYLFETLGYAGNEAEYYDPRNSYLNEVLRRRKGIPITLSLIYLDIANQLDFPMEGINFPGHFLIRPLSETSEFFIDPFNAGEILFPQDCQKRLAQLVGQEIELSSRFLQPITPQSFLVRMLNNLKHIYLRHQDIERSLAACERILLVDPNQTNELRDRGLLYYQLGRWREARHDLSEYLVKIGTHEESAMLEKLIRQIDQNLSP